MAFTSPFPFHHTSRFVRGRTPYLTRSEGGALRLP
jgi:hypothetical protein